MIGPNGRKDQQVARLVAGAFVQKLTEEACCVDHVDGDPRNNHYTNLRWVSYAEVFRSERHIPADAVREIAQDLRQGLLSQRLIAEKHGVPQPLVSNIMHGKVWSSITGASKEQPIFQEIQGRRVLDEAKVRQILADLRTSGMSQKKLGLKYGVSQATICGIATGRIWAHVREPTEAK
jgi:predicted XRE-type DNA-binding protein